jgi:hypothetical protein
MPPKIVGTIHTSSRVVCSRNSARSRVLEGVEPVVQRVEAVVDCLETVIECVEADPERFLS